MRAILVSAALLLAGCVTVTKDHTEITKTGIFPGNHATLAECTFAAAAADATDMLPAGWSIRTLPTQGYSEVQYTVQGTVAILLTLTAEGETSTRADLRQLGGWSFNESRTWPFLEACAANPPPAS